VQPSVSMIYNYHNSGGFKELRSVLG
jgi:hypothetical protein